MTPEQKDQFSKELYDLLTRFGNAIGITTHSIYTHEYEGDPGREYEAYQAIQASCIAMDELEPGDDPF
jgi:hypothetical protein